MHLTKSERIAIVIGCLLIVIGEILFWHDWMVRSRPGGLSWDDFTTPMLILLMVLGGLFLARDVSTPMVFRSGVAVGIITLVVGYFSELYWTLSPTSGTCMNTALTKLDSLYFTVSTLTTAGFGDIVPSHRPAE